MNIFFQISVKFVFLIYFNFEIINYHHLNYVRHVKRQIVLRI